MLYVTNANPGFCIHLVKEAKSSCQINPSAQLHFGSAKIDHDFSPLVFLSIPVSLAAGEISSLGHNAGMQKGRRSVSVLFFKKLSWL